MLSDSCPDVTKIARGSPMSPSRKLEQLTLPMSGPDHKPCRTPSRPMADNIKTLIRQLKVHLFSCRVSAED